MKTGQMFQKIRSEADSHFSNQILLEYAMNMDVF